MPNRPDPWTLLLAAGVVLVGGLSLRPALFPSAHAPLVTRVPLPAPDGNPSPAPTYPTTTSVTPLISGRLDVNTATREQLEALPKVGPALAEQIIRGRPYRSMADLDRVKGIGPSTLRTLEPLVRFQ